MKTGLVHLDNAVEVLVGVGLGAFLAVLLVVFAHLDAVDRLLQLDELGLIDRARPVRIRRVPPPFQSR